MKIDLTERDIELMLTILTESAADDAYFAASGFYSYEEVVLISKLENALKNSPRKDTDILDTARADFAIN